MTEAEQTTGPILLPTAGRVSVCKAEALDTLLHYAASLSVVDIVLLTVEIALRQSPRLKGTDLLTPDQQRLLRELGLC